MQRGPAVLLGIVLPAPELPGVPATTPPTPQVAQAAGSSRPAPPLQRIRQFTITPVIPKLITGTPFE